MISLPFPSHPAECRLSLHRCVPWPGAVCHAALRLVGRLVEVLELLYHVLQAVHVVPQDDPVTQVAVRRVVLHVAELAGHDVALHVRELHHALLGHGHLDLTQHLKQQKQNGKSHNGASTTAVIGWNTRMTRYVSEVTSTVPRGVKICGEGEGDRPRYFICKGAFPEFSFVSSSFLKMTASNR